MGSIDWQQSGALATVTLSNPARMNAMTRAMWLQLREAFLDIATRNDLRCVLVQGAGGNFSAGGDISEYPAFRFDPASLMHFHEVEVWGGLQAMLACPIPLLALVRGKRVGALIATHNADLARRMDRVVVLTDGEGRRDQIPVGVREVGKLYHVSVAGQTHEVGLDVSLREIAVHGTFDGKPFCAQIERVGLGYRIQHNGAGVFARVFTPRVAQLEALMPFKAPPDLSKVLLSPMPGLLVDVAVQVGQTVRAGEKLAAIEAMKMENILFAQQDCIVESISASKGESLAVDQVIMRFR